MITRWHNATDVFAEVKIWNKYEYLKRSEVTKTKSTLMCRMGLGNWSVRRMQCINDTMLTKIVSEYDQEIPQLQTADNPMAPRERATQPSRDTRDTN